MKTILLNTLWIAGIVLVCLMNPLAGLTLLNNLTIMNNLANDDDSEYEF